MVEFRDSSEPGTKWKILGTGDSPHLTAKRTENWNSGSRAGRAWTAAT